MSIEQFSLDGKLALVTGAGSGLGRQFATTLSSAGASVALAARRREKLEETAEIIRGSGGTAICLDLDVTDSGSVSNCFAELKGAAGAPDIVVNNAGIARQDFLVDMTEADWDAVIDTNLKGVYLVAQSAARAMIANEKPGSIINIASVLGMRVAKALTSYIAAKAGVIHMTRSMALELARHGIRVNAIAPGYFITEINQEQFDQGGGEFMAKRVPMGRVGDLPEISGPLLLLASAAGSYMTGSTVTVDGGHVCNSL